MIPEKPILYSVLRTAWLCFFITLFSLLLHAQCPSGLQKKAYNISLYGTGNNIWGFSLPQFDPSLGTLVAADVKSVVSVNMNFELANISQGPDNYIVLAGRNDNISVSALSSPISNSYSQDFGPYSLQSYQDTIVNGPISSAHFFSLMNNYIIDDSTVSATAGFLGTGFVSFHYTPYTYTTAISDSAYNIINNVSDTINVTMTYYYCTTNILSADITDFSVLKESESMAKLIWNTQNELPGRMYQVQVSSTGKDFDSVAMVAAVVDDGNGSYAYQYPIPSGTKGELYFRLKEINADGYTKYSEVRSIDLQNTIEAYIYPNPANDFINIVLGNTSANWDIYVFAADGRLVLKNYFLNTSSVQLNFAQRLPKGAYFVKAINRQTQKATALSFILQ
jgi:hypothetical protein